ncbi:MAG: saccharopine dehydrogenase C-terminal domain-containing protein [candidate division KSB1 bacterium]|nr:saccharopine dehydrogenase C-terminal domain-containing protein [candidate division KSB1 bacterium]
MNITILGAGMVGRAIVKDLAADVNNHVTAVDHNRNNLDKLGTDTSITVEQADILNDEHVKQLLDDSRLVINALPGSIGFKVLHQIISQGKDVVDISFFEQDAFELDKLAKSRGVTAVVDCGVAPGLCNILAGHVHSLLDETHRYICYVGGLPKKRIGPFEYKAPFSPSDVLQEYIRPARFIENGKPVVKPALSDLELIDFEEVGTLEAFNTDGLRTLQHTLNIANMCEKTLRYPGHAELMQVFKESGFFDADPVEVDGANVSPRSLTSKLLFDQWYLHDDEPEFTVMQVILEGIEDKTNKRYSYYLYDEYDLKNCVSSMARTTGYTCAIVARQILNGLYTLKGISPPEFLGRNTACYQDLLSKYKKRNINLTESILIL